jgi:hypothetical protein
MALLGNQEMINVKYSLMEDLLKLANKGIPRASAQWICAKAGGLEIIASAKNVLLVEEEGK